MKYYSLIIGLLMLNTIAQAASDIVSPEDLAWGITLNIKEDHAFYQLALPTPVYQGVTNSRLTDIRLFNGHNDIVPHDLLLPPKEQTTASRNRVKLYPLIGSNQRSIKSLSLQLTNKLPDGRVTLKQQFDIPTRNKEIKGYLLQLYEGKAPKSIQGVELEWKEHSGGFTRQMKVETSSDLENWQTQHRGAVIADLNFGGEHLEKRKIVLPPNAPRFLRLTPLNRQLSIPITGAWLLTESKQEVGIRQRASAIAPEVNEQGAYLFQSPGPIPTTEIFITPSQRNTLVHATLYSKNTPSGNWRVRSSGLIYTLSSEGAQLQNTNLPIKQVTDRYWKLATEEGKNGFGRSQPKIEFSWRPHNLRFSNRGEPPFTLAYGSRRLTDEITNTDLIRGLSREQQNILIGYQVAIGDVVTLGGTRALSGKIIADWKQWLLWGLLIAAALLLGWMAWSLMHRITT